MNVLWSRNVVKINFRISIQHSNLIITPVKPAITLLTEVAIE